MVTETPTLYVCHGDDEGPRRHPCRRVQEALRAAGIEYDKVIAAHGAAPHLAQRVNLAIVAKSGPERIRTFARERGWRHLRLLSSRNNTYNRDYNAETVEGEQVPILNVFVRDADGIRHSWASELVFAPAPEGEETRHVDSIWPIWHVLDLTPDGRGTDPDFPQLGYK
jgi:predicted dithiol-disulfide oxidoreductase (DUF899 family)